MLQLRVGLQVAQDIAQLTDNNAACMDMWDMWDMCEQPGQYIWVQPDMTKHAALPAEDTHEHLPL